VLSRASIRLIVAIAATFAAVLAGVNVGLDVGNSNHSTSTTITVSRTTSVAQRVVPPVTVTETTVRTRVVNEPPADPGIVVNYGAFAGKVRIVGAQWHSFERTIGAARVDMQVEYMGGAGCRVVKAFGVAATLFDRSGRIAETSNTGVSNLVRGVRTPITIRFFSRATRGRIELVVTTLSCQSAASSPHG
jgi:hypothetical protein